MKVSFYGTRGSIPVASADKVECGGNTTCIRVDSPCLPDNRWLVIDAGSGIVPLGVDALKSGVKEVFLFFTHYHHDHTQGLFLCPLLFNKSVRLRCFGPVELGVNPTKMMRHLMRPPYHPVSFEEVASHITGEGFEHPSGAVVVIHPKGVGRTLAIDELELCEQSVNQQISMGSGKYAISDCLVIKMLKTNHPENTISYRFEERPTGKVFVLLTDHENLDGMPNHLKRHLNQADLLIMDSQYTRKKYDESTSGFGHGTPDYCVNVARRVGAKKLGLIHHDPFASDKDVSNILGEAADYLEAMESVSSRSDNPLSLFACRDYHVEEI